MRLLTSSLSGRLAVIIFILICSTPAFAQKSTLQVKCVDQTGNPVSGVKVLIQELQTGKLKDRKTNRSGVAEFKKLKDGVYRILGRKKGFEPAFYEFVHLKGGSTESIELNFKPGDSKKKVYFEDKALMQQARKLLIDGINALRAKKFPEAEEKLKASLQIDPSSPDGHYNLAVAYLQQGKWDEGTQELKAASKLFQIMIVLQGPKQGTGPSPVEKREKQVERLIAAVPMFRLQNEAQAAMKQRKFEDAIATYSEIIKLQPKIADNYYNLALAQANAKHYDDALESVEKALTFKPDEKAYNELKKMIVAHKEQAMIARAKQILAQGDKLYNQGQYAAALQKYKDARPLIPEKVLPLLWAQMAQAYAKLNRPEETIKFYRQAIERAPDKTEYRKQLAEYYFQQKQYGQGMQVYADLYKQSSTPVDQGLFGLGKKFVEQEKTDLAEVAFEKVLEVNPQFAEAYYELGMHYFYDKKDKAHAQELLKKYLSLGKDQSHLGNAKAVLAVISR